ncbi:MAG: hypothetical protein V1494_05340 [Candidatus Diapherotrites archaeon]
MPENKLKPIPDNEKIDCGCSICCFRSKSASAYRFSVRNRIFEEIANRKEKIALKRDSSGDFIIRKSPKGKRLNLYKNPEGRPLAYISIDSSFLTKKEIEIFKNGKRNISYRAFVSKKELNIDISKFFSTREERELADALVKKGVNIKLPRMRQREGDILLDFCNAQIEITNIMPPNGNKNSPHSEGMHINGRLCEGFLRVTKKEANLFFVVFNEEWLKNNWVKKLIDQVKPKVISITTDFRNGWAQDVAEKIMLAANKVNNG